MSGVGGYGYSILGYPYLQMPAAMLQAQAASGQTATGGHPGAAGHQHPGAAAAAGHMQPYTSLMQAATTPTLLSSQQYMSQQQQNQAGATVSYTMANGMPAHHAAAGGVLTAAAGLQGLTAAGLTSQAAAAASRIVDIPPKPDQIDIPEDKDEYIKELMTERETIENSTVSNLSKSHVLRLLNQEITRLQGGGIFYGDDVKFLDVYREKCTRITIRVLVPVREHPKFNFVGKLLGPKGNSLKRIQEETLTKMAVLGRGSMRDKEKEEELRASGDPKYGHLQEELHVEITAYAPPAEAYARLAFALTEIRKYLIPDSNDTIRQQQMRELEILSSGHGGAAAATIAAAGLAAAGAGAPTAASLAAAQLAAAQPDSTSQLQLITSPPSILVPSHGYHIPLLPTPPLDTSPSPTITALPTKYEELQESLQQHQQQQQQQSQQAVNNNPAATAIDTQSQQQQQESNNCLKDKSSKNRNRKFAPY